MNKVRVLPEVADVEPLHRSPERNLLAAIIAQAIREAVGVTISGKECPLEVACAAREWLAWPGEAPFTFNWCCSHLDLDPDALRAAIHIQRRPSLKSLGRSYAANKRWERGFLHE